jgi:hypothetical protein
MTTKVLTLRELAASRKRDPTEIYYLAKLGRIPGAFKIGKQWRFVVPAEAERS